LAELDLTPEHRAVAGAAAPMMEHLAKEGLAHTLVTSGGRPVVVLAAANVRHHPPQECEVFIFPSRGRAQHRVAFWKGIKVMLAKARARYEKVHAVSKNEPALCNFFERLGFKPEPVPSHAAYVGMRGWVFLSLATFALDRFLCRHLGAPGVILADPVTAIALTAVASTTVGAVTGVLNYNQAHDAANAEKSLAGQQAQQLKNEQDAAAAQAAAQAGTGSQFGFTDQAAKTLATGFGFGTAPVSSPNTGRGQITGME